MTVQLLTLYTDPERHNAQRYRRTDRRTDDIMMLRTDHILRAVGSAKMYGKVTSNSVGYSSTRYAVNTYRSQAGEHPIRQLRLRIRL